MAKKKESKKEDGTIEMAIRNFQSTVVSLILYRPTNAEQATDRGIAINMATDRLVSEIQLAEREITIRALKRVQAWLDPFATPEETSKFIDKTMEQVREAVLPGYDTN